MAFKNFYIQVIIRVILLTGTIFFLLLSAKTQYLILPVAATLLVIMQMYYLVKLVNKTNRDLASFLESIRYSEFNRNFKSEGLGGSFEKLNDAFNAVIADFRQVRSEKEEHFHYLQSIVQSIDVSVIAYLPDGNIELINKAARKLFQINALKNVKNLETISHQLVETLLNIKPGKNYLVKIQEEDDILQLSISATEIKIKDKLIIIATIADIQNVLEEQETEAWQKLIRVLTHEIMNSITPIASLSSTLELMLAELKTNAENNQPLSLESVNEIIEALQTINKRSNGLLHFVNTYRNLTRIPKPNFKVTQVAELLHNIKQLMEKEIEKCGITCTLHVTPNELEIYADEQLIEQVIINLIKNSMHALEGQANPTIHVKAFQNKRGRTTIQVIDNGKGIIKEVLDKIFIPFFTTKPNGSGIGLSLSKQILKLHNGTITAQSIPEKETVFTLTF